MAIPIGNQKLIPDQLFALDYGGSYRAFALEVDRGTEPKTSPTARKSYARSIDLYRQLIERKISKSHYGLKTNLLVLWVFSTRSNEARFLEMVEEMGGKFAKAMLTQHLPDNGPNILHAGPCEGLTLGDWNRASSGAVPILCSKLLSAHI